MAPDVIKKVHEHRLMNLNGENLSQVQQTNMILTDSRSMGKNMWNHMMLNIFWRNQTSAIYVTKVEKLKPELLKAGLASLGFALDVQETLHSRDRLSTFELTTNKNGFHRFVFYNAVLISQKCILLGRRCQIILHRDEKSLKLTFYFLYFWCTLCTAQSPFKHRASKIFHYSC